MPKYPRKKTPKRILALPDLEHAKSAVLNSLSSASGQRTYDHAITSSSAGTVRSHGSRSTVPWCSATGSTWNSALRGDDHQPPSRRGRRIAYEAADAGLLSPGWRLASVASKASAGWACASGTGSRSNKGGGSSLCRHADAPRGAQPRDVGHVIGCGLRRGEFLALTVESLQRREEHWVIADVVGKLAMFGRSRFPRGSRTPWTRGSPPRGLRTAACFARSTRWARCGATG